MSDDSDVDVDATPKLTETEKNFFSSWSKDPTILPIGGEHFFVCQYTGMTTKHRAGLPGFLLGKSAKTVGTFGCFQDWNTLARALVDAKQNGWLTERTMDLISSWLATNLGGDKIDMPRQRENLERFGGQMSDDEYRGTYIVMYSHKLIAANDEHELREKNKAAAKANHHPAPTLLSALRSECDGAFGLFKVAILPQAPSWFALQRLETPDQGPFGREVLSVLNAEAMPPTGAGNTVVSDYGFVFPRSAENWMDQNMRPTKKAAMLANKERARLERAAKRKQSSAMSKLRKKVATKEKRRVEMATFAAEAAKMVKA